MNTLREAFERQAGNADARGLDVDELVRLGEHRLRRRRITAAAGAGAAVAIAIALASAGTAWNPSADHLNVPSDHPSRHVRTETPEMTTSRPIVYSDVTWRDGVLGDPIQVGDRAVRTGSGFVHMAVTDNGVVYATGGYRDDGRLWFSDGGTPVQIASHACPSAHGWPGSIIAGNSGSLAAWFDCASNQDPRNADLVVYDTGSGRVLGQLQDTGCSPEAQAISQCTVIIGDRVYVKDGVYTAEGADLVHSDGESFARGLRSNPRALVVGDSWEAGKPTTTGVFFTLGRRLVPFQEDERPTSAFDTATRQPVQLHLPPGYQPGDGADYGIFEWLDDDTIALEGYSSGRHDQDILTCQLSTGRCELAAPGLGRDRAYRVVQNESLGDVQFVVPD